MTTELAPHAGAIVVRKSGGPQMLVTTTSGTVAECQWWADDGAITIERIPFDQLAVKVIGVRVASYREEKALAEIAAAASLHALQREAEAENAARDAEAAA